MKTLSKLILFLILTFFAVSIALLFAKRDGPKEPIIARSSPVSSSGGLPEISGKPSVTTGSIRVRRRHENDMDFSKYNPFYWEGRQGSFKVEDYTSKGENRIEFTLYFEWPQDYIPTRGPDFSAIYVGDPSSATEHLRSKFAINARMRHVRDNRVFAWTISDGDFRAFANELQRGKVLTIEFRSFMSESFSEWQKQKARNPNNISSYYSEFFRIKIGEPGLIIDNPDKPNVEPSPKRYAGGQTTTPTTRVEPWKALEQQALNIKPEHSQAFMFGRTWSHTNFSTGEHSGEDSDDKPSVFFEGDRAFRAGFQANAYNSQTCVSCHEQNGSKLLPPVGQPVHTTILRTAGHPSFGQQLQTEGPGSEGTARIKEWKTKVETLSEGERVELRYPVWEVSSSRSTADLHFSPRRPLPWVGLGLLEAIPSDTIKAWAKENGGKISDDGGKIGRFGHKAERGSLRDQILSALNIDLGVKSDSSQFSDCVTNCKGGKGNLFDPAMNDVETYISLLDVPPRLHPEDQEVARGDITFRRIGCASCHVPDVTTGSSKFPELANQSIQPFTDLLLHDMGEGLEDSIPDSRKRLWRTTPLWGFAAKRASSDGRTNQFRPGDVSILWENTWKAAEQNKIEMLHDGRARTLSEAILWHGGEANASKEAFRALSKLERKDLLKFLEDI